MAAFAATMGLLSSFGSFVSGVLAVLVIFVKIPVFVLRAVGLKGPAEAIGLARRQGRTSRSLMIGQVLREGRWPAGTMLGAEDVSLLREELDVLIGEKMAYLRAARMARVAEERRQAWLRDTKRKLWDLAIASIFWLVTTAIAVMVRLG